jgi:uncharacterized protein (TIGR02246 family)
MMPGLDRLREFAKRYTAAWCSHNAASVGAHYSPEGSLTINKGTPAIGRAAITAAAQDFMTTFPDLQIFMDDVQLEGDHAIYKWTLEGTNTGPGGSGKQVRISGFEEWTIGPDNLVAESHGHFDQEEYDRQLRFGRD